MKQETFEEYLMMYFQENEISTDDVDMYESWLESQDVNDIMELAEKWGKKTYQKGWNKGNIDGQKTGVGNERKKFIEEHMPSAFEKGVRTFAYWVDDKEGGFFGADEMIEQYLTQKEEEK